MSIRPTDLQIIIQKTQEVERLQQTQQQQQKVQQQQVAEHLQKQNEAKERQVNSSPHADEVVIQNKDKNAEEKSRENKGKHKRSGNDAASEEKENKVSEAKHIIDIKI